jgi:hypothetical protein
VCHPFPVISCGCFHAYEITSAEIHLHGYGGRLRDCSRDLFIHVFTPALLFVPLLRLHHVVHRLHDDTCYPSTRRLFEGLHDLYLPALTFYGYIEQTHEIFYVNGAIDALSMGHSTGYILFFVFVHDYCCLLLIRVVIHTCTYMSSHISYYFFDYIKTENA